MYVNLIVFCSYSVFLFVFLVLLLHIFLLKSFTTHFSMLLPLYSLFTVDVKFTHTLQNQQNVNYLTKIRGSYNMHVVVYLGVLS